MSEQDEYWKQFTGSASANVVFIVIEAHCKHSRCSSNTSLCKCSVDNDDVNTKQRKHGLRHQLSVQTLYSGDSKKIPPRHKETV